MTKQMTALVFSSPSLGDRNKTSLYWAYDNRARDLHACDPQDSQQVLEMIQMWLQREADIYAVSEPAFAVVYEAIIALCNEQQRKLPLIKVCSPLSLRALIGINSRPGQGRVNNQLNALSILSTWTAPSSVGGFRFVSAAEAASYAVINALDARDGRLEQAVRKHPLRHVLASGGGSDLSQAIVIERLLDPRNFIDNRRPDHMSILRRRFDVHPFGMASLWRLKQQLSPIVSAAKLSHLHVLDCLGETFAGGWWLKQPQQLVGHEADLPLLLRIRLDDLQKDSHPGTIDPRDWWLGGSRFFLRFLRDVWLDETQDIQSRRPMRLCDYSHYFPSAEMRANWAEHCAQFDECETH